MGWPNLVKAYVAGINATFSVRAAVEAPADLNTLPGFVRVTRGPGSDDKIFESTLIDFDVFAPSYGAAETLVGELREWVLSTHNREVGGEQIGRVYTATSPTEVDWGNPNVTRFVYSARVTTRRT